MNFNAQKYEGGWLVTVERGHKILNDEKIVTKDSELIKQFKAFVEQSKVQTLNEG